MLNKRNYSIDSLKFFCILGVICIHTLPFSGMEFSFIGTQDLSIVLNTIVRVCVPLFFITSGYLFYNKCNAEYTIKYIINLMKVLIVWNIIYILYNICIHIMSNLLNSRSIFSGILEYLSGFKIIDLYYATGIVYYHLWYLSTIIIVIPILYYIIKKNLLEKTIKVALVLNIIGVLVPVFISASLWIRVRDAIFFGLFYTTLGAYINKYEYKFKEKIEKINKCKYLAIIIFLFGVSIVERCLYLSIFKGAGDYFISTIPLSILIFGICLVNTEIFKDTIINRIGKHTLGIYVIHPLILSIVSLVLLILNMEGITNTIIWQVVYTPIVLILSYLIYNMLCKLKQIIINLIISENKKLEITYNIEEKSSN